MDIHEDPEVGGVEQATRFACGAVLGVVLGVVLAVKWALSSLGAIAGDVVVAVLVCGLLALKYGDAFWYGIFGPRN